VEAAFHGPSGYSRPPPVPVLAPVLDVLVLVLVLLEAGRQKTLALRAGRPGVSGGQQWSAVAHRVEDQPLGLVLDCKSAPSWKKVMNNWPACRRQCRWPRTDRGRVQSPESGFLNRPSRVGRPESAVRSRSPTG
jgi:hypothetical protein